MLNEFKHNLEDIGLEKLWKKNSNFYMHLLLIKNLKKYMNQKGDKKMVAKQKLL